MAKKSKKNTTQAKVKDRIRVISMPDYYDEETTSKFPPVPFESVCIKSVPGRRIWVKSPKYVVTKTVPGESSPRQHPQYKYLELWPEHYEILSK